jgi:UDP-N-acetylglucosamine 1-carboxyvinyltransferase
MKRIVIEGGHPLTGTIKIGGAKNSVVALIPASILAGGLVHITNVPNISDRDALIQIMELLGAKVISKKSEIIVDSTNVENKLITETLSRRLRASYYFMGLLLGKYKHAEVYLPGGCNIGTRPINFHLKGFESLGATVTREGDKYTLDAKKLVGAPINLEFSSVGATINIMFAAIYAEGTTTISNAARETEIVNIADFLNRMGAKIKGAGTKTIIIEGVKELHPADIEVIPDRIEAGTYIIIGSLIGQNLSIEGVVPENLDALFKKLKEMGIDYKLSKDKVMVTHNDEINPVNVKTLVYPGFPTDLGQPMQVLLTQANGISYFDETIYENRMQHVPQLLKMGAKIKVMDSHAEITGPVKLKGATLTATDLRGGAALVLAALIADGKTIINDADHILRGYERIIQKLSKVGAKIKIEEI